MSCTGCTRRALLHGIGLAIAGCKIDLDKLPTDAPPPDTSEPPVPCEPGKFCIDLTRESAMALAAVGGSLRVVTASGTLMVVRTDEGTFEVTSAICTHKGCAFRWNGTVLNCPCHGSQFTLEGAVVKGPAMVALKTYEAVFDPATHIVTITL
jgi:nitrite reductase/ring-hydroxylating ferredoxin subunit